MTSAIMLYDADCGFCNHWVRKWRGLTGERVQYEPYQKAMIHYPQLTENTCKNAVQFIDSNGNIFSAAHAVLKTLSFNKKYAWLLWSYEHLSLFHFIAEWGYRWVANNRMWLSQIYSVTQCKINVPHDRDDFLKSK